MKTIYKKLLFLLLLLPISVLAQSTLSGTVVDSKSKNPIPGVNIVVQGTSTGTSTDFEGNFKLNKLKKGDKILISFVGYQNEIVVFNNQQSLKVSLQEMANQLEEVKVQVGYGSVKKRDATGAVTLITAKDFNKGAITSVDGLLNGRASGVVVTSSGTPGNDAVIRIRGGSSLLASNDPLIVIDGLPIDGVSLSSLNPDDIESFSILKDASSTAIYGNRGSNGVILITTKKGSKKDVKVTFNTFTTVNTLAKETNVYSASDYRNLIATIAPTKVSLLGNANTDWQKEIFKNSFTSDVSLSVLGNLFSRVPSRLTIGNTDNNGILLTSQFKRTSASISLNPTFFEDHLKFNITGNYSYVFRRNADEGAIGSALSYDPTQSVYNPNGPYAGYTEWVSSNGQPTGTSNPVAMLLERRDISNNKRFFGNINMEYKFHFLPELKAIVNAGIDKQDGDGSTFTNPAARSGIQSVTIGGVGTNLPIGYYQTTWYHNSNKNLNAQLNYAKKIRGFNLDLLGGYEYQQFDWQNYHSGNINSYPYLIAAGTSLHTIEDIYTDPGNNLQAFFGRMNLGFRDKYLLTVNFRRDGSSRVSPLNKWANFGGFAFAWKIKDETFLKDSKLFSDLKLRLSIGDNGNQNIPGSIPWFKYYAISTNNYYQFGSTFYNIAKPVGYNDNLKWERSRKYNAGLDFGFLNNRLKATLDVYYGKTTDLFANTVQGSLQNLAIFGPTNIGSLDTKGIDFGLNYQVIKNENLDLNFNYNITYNDVKILSLFTDNQPQGGVGLGGYVQTFSVGYSPFAFNVYQQVYDAQGKPIQGVYVDRNHDGVIDSKDKYIYKKPQAPVTMGFMVNANFLKNWDFNMAWRASIGNYVYDQVSADRAALSSIVNIVDGTINNSPVDYSNTNFTTTNKESDYYIKNASFLKLDNLSLGYTFQKVGLSKTNVRVYSGVKNVLTITQYKGIDPEVFNNGIDGTIFPRSRNYMVGVNVNF